MAYIYNNRIRLEDNVRQLQANVRFRKIDMTDCFELLVAQTELETFKEVTNQLRLLLNLSSLDDSRLDFSAKMLYNIISTYVLKTYTKLRQRCIIQYKTPHDISAIQAEMRATESKKRKLKTEILKGNRHYCLYIANKQELL